MPLPYEPIQSDPVINVPNPATSNPDLPSSQMPTYTRIAVTNLVGPTAANMQHQSAEKRTLSLLASIQRMATILAAIDNVYLRLDSSLQKNSVSGLTAPLNFNSNKGINLAAGTATGNAVNYDQFAALVTSDSLKAPLASPALTGNPTTTTQAGSDNSTRIASTAFVQGLISSSVIVTGDVLLTGTGTFTVPASVFFITALIVGGGASGGGATDGVSGPGQSGAGGGAGRGGVRRRRIPVTPGQTFNYTCGAGAAINYPNGGTNPPAGNAGGTTTFGTITAPGGTPAVAASRVSVPAALVPTGQPTRPSRRSRFSRPRRQASIRAPAATAPVPSTRSSRTAVATCNRSARPVPAGR